MCPLLSLNNTFLSANKHEYRLVFKNPPEAYKHRSLLFSLSGIYLVNNSPPDIPPSLAHSIKYNQRFCNLIR